MNAPTLALSLRFLLACLCAAPATASPLQMQEQLPLPGDAAALPAARDWTWRDFDGDGRLDVLALTEGGRLRLLANRGGAGFEEVTVRSGLGDLVGVELALWGDYDADGYPDLFLALSLDASRLLHNEGASFADVTEFLGLDVTGPVHSAHWLDEDGDGRLDLHLVAGGSNRILRGAEGGGFELVELPLGVPGPASVFAPEVPRLASGGMDVPLPRGTGPVIRLDPGLRPTGRSFPHTNQGEDDRISQGAPSEPEPTTAQLTVSPLQCIVSLQDQAAAGMCLQASSSATLGSLYPLTSRLFVDEATGHVGMGTTGPLAGLHVANGAGILATGTEGVGSNPLNGPGVRFAWYPGKAALRSGFAPANEWDEANISTYSVAMGYGTTASGIASTAMGGNTEATGSLATALGHYSEASGGYSTAIGSSATASGDWSTALGSATTASGLVATALGSGSEASGRTSTALGQGTTASGEFSTAMGLSTHATGSTVTALGRYNVGSGDPLNWVDTDPLLEVGNGSSDVARANALTLLKNGNLGLGTTTPAAGLELQSERGLVAHGTIGMGTIPASGPGVRLMWYPGKAAFRSGMVLGDEWEDAKVGGYSTAAGHSTEASGTYSTAFGVGTVASSNASVALGSSTEATSSFATAMGQGTEASGTYSTALGRNTKAIGTRSTAMGDASEAAGDYGTALGYDTRAASAYSTAAGRWNVGGGSSSSWIATDPLFEIGNGSGDLSRANAVTVLKNGNVGIGTTTPETPLEVAGIIRSSGAGGGELSSANPNNSAATAGLSWLNDVARIRVGGNGTGALNGLDIQSVGNASLLRLLNNGRVGIGTTTPTAGLEVRRNNGMLAAGTFGSGSIPETGSGVRMMWYPRRAAFRAGSVSSTQWDAVNVGNYSVALGSNARASGLSSLATGNATIASQSYSTAMGGSTTASGQYSTALGGGTTASGDYSTASGSGTTASGGYSTALGLDATAIGLYSLAAGDTARAEGDSSAAIGEDAMALGDFSFAFGRDAEAIHAGSFVWGDGGSAPNIKRSTTANEFAAYCSGGARFLTGGYSVGVFLAPGAGTWSAVSDRDRKENVEPVDARAVLEQVVSMPIATWNYRTQDPAVRHMGPMAQDFRGAFGLGVSEKAIDTVDADGVALAAIQGLKAELDALRAEKDTEIRELREQVRGLRERLEGKGSGF